MRQNAVYSITKREGVANGGFGKQNKIKQLETLKQNADPVPQIFGERANLTEPLREIWEKRAKENLILSGGDRKSKDKKSGFVNSQNPINTTKELTKKIGLLCSGLF